MIPSLDLLHRLIRIFYSTPDALGHFTAESQEQLPKHFAKLLAHHEHMTVTVEAFHGCPVDVEVLETKWQSPIYCRKILLRKSTDQTPVQFGLVRLDTSVLAPQVRDEIIDGKIPLGRVLIQHNVMRKVQLETLWRIEASQELAGHFNRTTLPIATYGRTAIIHFGNTPALELLEIVAPME